MLSCFSPVLLFETPWTVAHQAPLSMGFSRQEYCSGLPFPPPGDLLDPGIKPVSHRSPALAGGFFTTSATWETLAIRFFLLFILPVMSNSLWLHGLQHPRPIRPSPSPGDCPGSCSLHQWGYPASDRKCEFFLPLFCILYKTSVIKWCPYHFIWFQWCHIMESPSVYLPYPFQC